MSDFQAFAIIAHRTGASQFGAASSEAMSNGKPLRFATEAEAQAKVDEWHSKLRSQNVYYTVTPVRV